VAFVSISQHTKSERLSTNIFGYDTGTGQFATCVSEVKVKVKKSLYRPGQVLRFSGG
jgi:hypothetical protein